MSTQPPIPADAGSLPAPATSPAPPPRWALDLEDGPLKRELLGEPVPAAPAQAPPVLEEPLAFTGTGSEYFRIWAVHVFLTLITLGVYSAWAKVRKMRWFAQHTQLLGDPFDYHGDPKRILAGRVVALLLLLGYGLAFNWSDTAELLMRGALCAVGPWLYANAQCYKLVNTSWRGLRFGFRAPLRAVYGAWLPLLVLLSVDSVLVALQVGERWSWGTAALLILALSVPLLHARLKRLQHSHASFGNLRFNFLPVTPELYGLYGSAVALILVLSIGVGLLASAVALIGWNPLTANRGQLGPPRSEILVLIFTGMITYSLVWPYFAARMQRVVWGHTLLGPVAFVVTKRVGELKIFAKNGALVLLTAGLYWPFAAVAIARYRITTMVVRSSAPLSTVAAAVRADARSAAGDGAADFFGVDQRW
jgi:uncharacterized membrane protein YjgN (DUF898 family)